MTTEKKSKKANYSEEQIEALLLAVNIASLSYESQAEIVQDLANDSRLFIGKTKNQLMAKLAYISNNGTKKQVDGSPAYVHRVYKNSSSNHRPVKKSALVTAIAEKLKVSDDVLGSLESATKPVLLLILANLKEYEG